MINIKSWNVKYLTKKECPAWLIYGWNIKYVGSAHTLRDIGFRLFGWSLDVTFRWK